MLHEKPRPIYIREGMSQWGQNYLKLDVYLLLFEVFTGFTQDFQNHGIVPIYLLNLKSYTGC